MVLLENLMEGEGEVHDLGGSRSVRDLKVV